MQEVTEKLFSICFQIAAAQGISKENCNHLIRTFRAFLEGFCLLVNNYSFGHSLPIENSFNLSLQEHFNVQKAVGRYGYAD